jgi:hydroxyacylglutathione hydrolase
MTYDLHLFRCRTDNVGALVRDRQSGLTACIDASEETAILTALQETGRNLDLLLITHGHPDHIEAVNPLRQRFSCPVLAPEKTILDGPVQRVNDGDVIRLGAIVFTVLAIPGHTPDHIAFYAPSDALLFCGDTLFILGCGRAREENYPDLYASLQRLAALPDETRFVCGHDYVSENLRFARTLDPTISAPAPGFTASATMAEEKLRNPFLRLTDPVFRKKLNAESLTDFEVFSLLRTLRSRFVS